MISRGIPGNDHLVSNSGRLSFSEEFGSFNTGLCSYAILCIHQLDINRQPSTIKGQLTKVSSINPSRILYHVPFIIHEFVTIIYTIHPSVHFFHTFCMFTQRTASSG